MSGRSTQSLLAGRSTRPLTETEQRTAINTLLGLDDAVPFRPDAGGATRFVVETDEDGGEIGTVVIGRDVYPGSSVLDPNSALSMTAALAHEIVHYHRWVNRTELPDGVHTHLDEAFTSLEAALRFPRLSSHDVQSLIRDAVQRLSMHWAELSEREPDAN